MREVRPGNCSRLGRSAARGKAAQMRKAIAAICVRQIRADARGKAGRML
jgi:hypothetical protein